MKDRVRFSELTGTRHGSGKDDWFDPLLSADTRLFVDPFLVWGNSSQRWRSAHDHLIDFFNVTLSLIARSGFNRASAHWRAAERLLMFPEPSEFCLGYSEGSTLGSGSGRGLGRGILEGAAEAVRKGIESVEHFEELSLFEGGIGADRISDAVCNVLKSYFIEYTQEICGDLGIETGRVLVRNASWSRTPPMWNDRIESLPLNPFSRRPILLTPTSFLRDLPSVDPVEFWDYAWSTDATEIRDEFNYDVGTRVDRHQIARLARRHPELVKAYVRSLEDRPKGAYDLESDPDFTVRWYDEGKRAAAAAPLAFVASQSSQFPDFVGEIIKEFVHYVEDQDGWRLLWFKDRARSERDVQALFRGTVIHYCRANDIDLTGEANAGRGPVDFKFSRGWGARALVEVKLIKNSQFWNGVRSQLPQYLKAEAVQCGFFLAVGFRDIDFERERRQRVYEAASAASAHYGLDIRPVFLDARSKESASKRPRIKPRADPRGMTGVEPEA